MWHYFWCQPKWMFQKPHDLDRQVAGRSKLLQTIVASMQTSRAQSCLTQHVWGRLVTVESTLLRLQYLGSILRLQYLATIKQIPPISFCILLPCLSLTPLSFPTLHVHRWSQGLGRDSRHSSSFRCTDTPIWFWWFWWFWQF